MILRKKCKGMVKQCLILLFCSMAAMSSMSPYMHALDVRTQLFDTMERIYTQRIKQYGPITAAEDQAHERVRKAMRGKKFSPAVKQALQDLSLSFFHGPQGFQAMIDRLRTELGFGWKGLKQRIIGNVWYELPDVYYVLQTMQKLVKDNVDATPAIGKEQLQETINGALQQLIDDIEGRVGIINL